MDVDVIVVLLVVIIVVVVCFRLPQRRRDVTHSKINHIELVNIREVRGKVLVSGYMSVGVGVRG